VSQAVVLRRATRKDHATILGFHRELYVRFRDQIAQPELVALFAYRDMEETLRDDVDGLLLGRGTRVLLAERAGAAIGYVSGHVEVDTRRVLSRRGVVEDWYVLAGERGQGVGHQLLQALIDWFREEGCEMVESGTWAFNAAARRAHARAGFHEIEIKFRRRL
jgi:GNAT superfamily N-acetyltransferase